MRPCGGTWAPLAFIRLSLWETVAVFAGVKIDMTLKVHVRRLSTYATFGEDPQQNPSHGARSIPRMVIRGLPTL